jgi:general secretion pathway protein B
VSLILDALRKADAERERGSVPSLHSQPVVSLSVERPAQPTGRPTWLWIAIGVAVGLAAAAAWVAIGRDDPAPVAAPPAGPTPAAPPIAPAPPTALAAPPTAVGVAAPSGTAPIAEPAPWPQPVERRAPRPDAKDEGKGAQAGSVASTEAPVYAREQLPPNIRAELPQLAIGGSIYSPSPAGRSLIVNGQLFREKDRLTADLALEEIKLKAAVFSFRGYRFEVLF